MKPTMSMCVNKDQYNEIMVKWQQERIIQLEHDIKIFSSLYIKAEKSAARLFGYLQDHIKDIDEQIKLIEAS